MNSPQIAGLGGSPADSMLDFVLGLARRVGPDGEQPLEIRVL